jgi:hypothetical protein
VTVPAGTVAEWQRLRAEFEQMQAQMKALHDAETAAEEAAEEEACARQAALDREEDAALAQAREQRQLELDETLGLREWVVWERNPKSSNVLGTATFHHITCGSVASRLGTERLEPMRAGDARDWQGNRDKWRQPIEMVMCKRCTGPLREQWQTFGPVDADAAGEGSPETR